MISKRCSPSGDKCGPFQQFTECCMKCWHNTYKSESEYLHDLKIEKANRIQDDTAQIRQLEKELFGG